MNQGTTRIADLPDNPNTPPHYNAADILYSQRGTGAGGVGGGNGGGAHSGGVGGGEMPSGYVPMNVHPNPYGNSQQPAVMPLPQMVAQPRQEQMQVPMPNGLTQEQQMMLNNMPRQRLPSRDIKMDTTLYSQDEEVQPNYIPKGASGNDYVRDYESNTEGKLEKHEQVKHRERLVDTIMTELQTPLIVGLLFFIFQLPFLNSLLFKKLSFLSLYTEDGTMNFRGILLKSVIFGAAFWTMMKGTDFVSSL
jgi:hypothetical protein